MKRLWLIPVVLIVGVFLLWQLWFTLLLSVREPDYKRLVKKEGYEIRKTRAYLTAHVDLTGSYEETINEGFKILFAYISGNNHTQACLQMKLPMLHEACQRGESIPMTAPVFVDEGAAPEQYRISFVLPQDFTLATVPQPRDQRIVIEEELPRTIAVYRFTWYPTAARVEAAKEEFLKLLKRDGLRVRSAISLARYNPPFILPFFMRNELIVTVEELTENV